MFGNLKVYEMVGDFMTKYPGMTVTLFIPASLLLFLASKRKRIDEEGIEDDDIIHEKKKNHTEITENGCDYLPDDLFSFEFAEVVFGVKVILNYIIITSRCRNY